MPLKGTHAHYDWMPLHTIMAEKTQYETVRIRCASRGNHSGLTCACQESAFPQQKCYRGFHGSFSRVCNLWRGRERRSPKASLQRKETRRRKHFQTREAFSVPFAFGCIRINATRKGYSVARMMPPETKGSASIKARAAPSDSASKTQTARPGASDRPARMTMPSSAPCLRYAACR